MSLTHGQWAAIQEMVNNMLAAQGEYFVQDVVVKSDPVRQLIWTKEFGDQPIPIFAFDYQVKYYSNTTTSVSGATPGPYTIVNSLTPRLSKPYTKEVQVLTPRKGDVVLVARHLGARRLPKCLGVLRSKNFITESGD